MKDFDSFLATLDEPTMKAMSAKVNQLYEESGISTGNPETVRAFTSHQFTLLTLRAYHEWLTEQLEQ